MRKIGYFIIFCCLAFAATFLIWHQKNQSTESASNHSPEERYQIDQATLDDSIQDIINANPRFDIGVAIVDLQTRKTYHYGETAGFDGASIGKIITATTILHHVEMEKLSLSDRIEGKMVRELLSAMIIESDNTAWTALNRRLGKPELNRFAHMLGLSSYQAENNILTAADIAHFIAKISSYKLLNSEHTDMLLSLMKQADMRGFIVQAVPDGTAVFHKGGYLDDRLHDAAIIQKSDRAYVLVIFSKSLNGRYDYAKGAQIFGAITDATLRIFMNNE